MFKRISALWLLVRGDAKRLWYALKHPQAPRWLKAGTGLVLLYLLSPVDLIPDVLPFFGVLDDLVIVPAAIRWMLNRLPSEVANAASARAAGHPDPTRATQVVDEVR